jgi:hypothetical protein
MCIICKKRYAKIHGKGGDNGQPDWNRNEGFV